MFKFQIFRAKPQNTLSVHFGWIAGRDFQLNVTDGRASNKTLITNITADYIGKTVRSASSPVLEISFSSKSNAREPTYLVFIIMENEGINFVKSVKRHIFAEKVARLHITYNGYLIYTNKIRLSFNPQMYMQIHIPTVVQGGGGGWNPSPEFLIFCSILFIIPLVDSL